MRIAIVLLALTLAPCSEASSQASTLRYERAQLTDGIHMFVPSDPGLGNTTAIVSGGEAVVVDATGTPATARDVLRSLESLGVQRIRALIVTHWHDDHIWGIQAFEEAHPGLAVVAHPATVDGIREQAIPALADQLERLRSKLAARDDQLRLGLLESGEPMADEARARLEQRQDFFTEVVQTLEGVRPTLPNLILTGDWTLRLDGLTVVVRHLGRGHTAGDLIVYVPERGVLVAGDLVTHPLPAAAGGFLIDWVDVLRQIEELKWDFLVPGHGVALSNREYLTALRELMSGLVRHVRTQMAETPQVEALVDSTDVDAFAIRFLNDDARLRAALRAFFVEPGVEGVLRQLQP